MEQPTTVWLVRHGQPADLSGRCYGRHDTGLSPDGAQQAKDAAQRLAHEPLTTVYSSPLKRALETARIVAEPHHLPVEIVSGLVEIDFGDFEGLTYEDIQARYPAAFQSWMERPTETQFPNGESFAAMRRRVLSAVAILRDRHCRQSIAIVSHSGAARILLAEALAVPSNDIFRLAQRYAAINRIDYFSQSAVVQLMNG
jgi:alpha-ribazole phosphatase